MDNSLTQNRNPVFGHPVPGSVMASSSRAGVLVDPMPLPGQPASLRTDISQDLLEQRGTQEQAKLRERFKLLQQWQQQQQNQLMLQQQQQLELLRNQQEVVQQALMQQRLKQWGGMKVTNSPPKSPSHKRSPKKSPTPSPTRGTKVPSSVPKTLAQAAMTQPVSTQNGHLPAMENLHPATRRCGSSTLQEDRDLDSESEHPGSLMVEGVYPLPDTASEASDAGNDDDHHDNLFEGRNRDTESRDDEIFRSVSDFSMTPNSRSPRDIHHLSIHLPDTDRTGESLPLQSPDHYPSSTLSPQLSPFTPTTPSRQGGNHSTLNGGEDGGGGEGRGKEERPIQSQLGAEFKSFEELVELQIKADDRTLPTAGSTTSEQTTGRLQHTFLKRGEGISRFGMKPRKFKPRKDKPARPTQSGVRAKKPKSDGSRVGSKTDSLGGKQRENVGKKKQLRKEEPPKISRKVSSKPPSQSQPDVQAPENIFKKPHPAPAQKPKTIKPVMSPVEREKVGVALQHRLMVPSLDLPYSSQSELDDTLEVSFIKRANIWEKKTKIEQEDLDEFEMLEEAADDNVSFCSEASLVISVLQRAQRRKQELLGISPLIKKAPLPTLQSVDATEENDYESHDRSPDQSLVSTLMNGDYTKNVLIASDKRNGYSEEQTHEQRGTKVTDGKPSLAVHRETVPSGRLTLSDGHTAEIRDDFYSSGGESDEETVKDVDDVGVERTVMRKLSKRSSEKGFMMEYQLDSQQDEDQSGRIEGKEDNKHLGRLHDSDEEEENEEEEEEEEDFDIYRTGMNENTNNNSNTNVKHEMLLSQNRITSSQSIRTSSSTTAKSSHPNENGNIHNSHSVGKLNISDEFEEDFEGTPRKTVASPEVADQVEFEDEETWGDFTAQLSDSSDEDSIVAMAPNLKSTPAKDEGKVGMKRKKSEKTASEEVLLSPPPTSALVAKLFPKLRQPDVKQKQQIEHEEKALHAKAERPAGEGSQARLLRDRLTQLENEIERFRKENLLLAKLREEREKGLESMKKEMEEFQKQKAEELQRIQEYKDEETKKLKRERKMFEKHQKTLRTMPDKRDREEIEMLKDQLGELQTELKQRESRWNASTRRLKDRTVALETENTELREEVRLMEQRRLAAWKKEENNKAKPIYAQPSSVPKPSPPARHENQMMEQSNNNNINKKRPGSEDRPIIRNGDSQHHRGSGKSRTMSESSDDDDSDNEYLQAYPAPRMEPSKQDDDIIYESQIALRRSRSPSDRERLPIPVPSERTPPPARTKPSSLSPSSPSSTQHTPLNRSPQHLPHPRPRGSPHRDIQNGQGFNHGVAGKGVVSIHQNGGDEDEDYEDVIHGDGKVEQINPDGSRVLTFSNGTRKEISADGQTIIISFFNGDVKQILPDQRVVYYYSETKTTHTTYQDGLEILQFSNNQTEKHYPDGTKEITFPDQTIKYLFPNGGEESVFADGTVLRVDPNGHRVMEFPNGQREIHTDQYKRREYPDGTVKTVYPDGRQETRYSSGRIRIKDKTGNIVVDRKG